jgi:hypothetical protein
LIIATAYLPTCSSHFETQQKFNDEKGEPLYDEIIATEAADYEAFIQKKSEYDYEKPSANLEKEISFEMSKCSAYGDRTLKKQN